MTFFLDQPLSQGPVKANAPNVDLPTWGAGFAAGMTKAQLETDSNFVAARQKSGVIADTTLNAARRLGPDAITDRMRAKGMPEGMIETFPTMVKRGFSDVAPDISGIVLEAAREAAEANPAAWADIDLTDEGIDAKTNALLQAEYQDALQVLSMMQGGRSAAEFLGGMVGMTADVKNVPFMMLGGGTTSIARAIGRGAAINMGAEAAFLPSQFKMSEKLDIEDPDVLLQLGMAAVAGGILDGTVTAAGRGWDAWRGRNRVEPIGRMDEIQSAVMVDQVEDILSSTAPDPMRRVSDLIDKAGDDVKDPPFLRTNPINPERRPLVSRPEDRIADTPAEAVSDTNLVETVQEGPRKPKGRRPTSLKTFVVQEGGIWKGDDQGDISALEYGGRVGFEKVNKRVESAAGNNGGGRTLDDMLVRSKEEGFLPEEATINDLLDALDGDIRGTKRVYSQQDGVAADEWRTFDGEVYDERYGPTALDDYDTMKPAEGGLFIDRDAYYFDRTDDEANALIESRVRAYMDEKGVSDILSDVEKDEIVAELQKSGGESEYLLEVVAEREAQFAEAPEARNDPIEDIPFGEPIRQDGQGSGRPGPVSEEAGSGAQSAGDSTGAAGARSEPTAAGDQRLIDGVAPITQRDRLQSQQNAALRGGNAPADGGLFDVSGRGQADMFSDPSSPEARAVQDTVTSDLREQIETDGDFDLSIALPDGNLRQTKAGSVLDYLDEAEAFGARLDLCGAVK